MKRLFIGSILFCTFVSCFAQNQGVVIRGEASAGVYKNIPVNGSNYLLVDCPACTGSASPTGANNADGVASVGTGLAPTQSFLFGYNGTTWDRVQVDGSKNLKVNCASGCAGGTFNNNSDAVATSATNGQSAAWMYGFNGTTWDRLQVDASKFLKVAIQNASIAVTNGGTFAVQAAQSGTWNITNVSGTVSLPTGASTAAKQPALGTAGSASTDVITVQGIASMTALKVDGSAVTQPISAASLPLPTSAATSTKQSDGTQKTQIVDGSGNVIASTSNNLNVQCANCSGSGVSTADEATFTAGSSLFAGSGGFFQTTATNNALTTGQQGMFQVTANRALFSNLRNAAGTEVGTSTTPLQVSLANTAANSTAVKVDGSAVTQPVSGTVSITSNSAVNVAQVGGTAVVADPCQAVAKTNVAISQAGSTQIISGTSSKKTYICSIYIQLGATTDNVSVTAGTGSVCATGASAIIGSTTVANGLILPASGGFTLGNGGATVASGTVNADNICILQTGSVRLSGVLTYVQQ